MVSHLPTSFASDVISVTSILYVFKFLTDLLHWSLVLPLSAAFHSGAVPCVAQIFLLSVSYRSCNPWRHVVMYLPVSVAFYGHSDAFLHVSVVLDVTNLFSYVCLLPTVPEIDCFLLCLLSKIVSFWMTYHMYVILTCIVGPSCTRTRTVHSRCVFWLPKTSPRCQ